MSAKSAALVLEELSATTPAWWEDRGGEHFQQGVITYGKWGAWESLKNSSWAERFTPDRTTPSLLNAPFMPVADIQAMYEDLIRYAENHPV